MATYYRTIPIFLSGFNVITGYTCPENKTSIIKQITFANETNSPAYIDVKWCDKNGVGIGTTAINSQTFYPVIISGAVSGYSTMPALREFISLQSSDFITYRTPQTGRVNVLMTILEQDI